MKFIISSLILSLLFATVAFGENYQFATCVFGPFANYTGKDDMIQGSIQIFKSPENIQFYYNINGLRNITYAVQVLEYGLHTSHGDSELNLGDVFNPENLSKGACPSNGDPRVGDIGNIAVVNGQFQSLVNLTKPSIGDDQNSIIGRSIALFEASYDCEKGVVDFSKSLIASYCTIGVGNLAFVDQIFGATVDLKVDKNTARSNSNLGNVLALAQVYNTLVVPEDIQGNVFFKNINDTFVRVDSKIDGLSYQAHGFHIHEFGERSDLTGFAVGDHLTIGDQEHALPDNKTRHTGDMGNFCAFNTDMTTGYYHYETDYFKVVDLIGRGMAVHDTKDNGTYAGGKRVAQGIIAIIDPNSGDVVQLPSEEWIYDIICPNGAYKGGASSYNDPSDYPTDDPSNASNISSFIALVIISVISTIVLI